jgi:hypothetical protein
MPKSCKGNSAIPMPAPHLKFTVMLSETRIAKLWRKWPRFWTLLDARRPLSTNGMSDLAALGVGFDSHRPLQQFAKSPLIRLSLLTYSPRFALKSPGFCAHFAPNFPRAVKTKSKL